MNFSWLFGLKKHLPGFPSSCLIFLSTSPFNFFIFPVFPSYTMYTVTPKMESVDMEFYYWVFYSVFGTLRTFCWFAQCCLVVTGLDQL